MDEFTKLFISSVLGALITGAITLIVTSKAIKSQNEISSKAIKSQNESTEKTRIYESIHNNYFLNGLFPIETALSSYGSSTIFAFNDVLKYMSLLTDKKTAFNLKIKEIKDRTVIKDLINRDFTLASKYFSRNLFFGKSFYTSIKRTLQLYSDYLVDILSPGFLEKQISEATSDELRQVYLI